MYQMEILRRDREIVEKELPALAKRLKETGRDPNCLFLSLSVSFCLHRWPLLCLSLFFSPCCLSSPVFTYHVEQYLSLSVSLSVYICLSPSLSVYMCLSPSLSLSIYVSLSVYMCLSPSLSVYICISLPLSLCLYMSLSVSLSICVSLPVSLLISLCLRCL